jgi:hypothetical protein
VLILAACGGGRSISTDAGAKALRAAGFRHMVIHRHIEIATGGTRGEAVAGAVLIMRR